MAAISRLPTFFIVGAQKAGTTSLHAYLGQHPDVYVSPLKEPAYFMAEEIPERYRMSWDTYVKLFSAAGDRAAVGEATAGYLWSPSAPANIAARLPHAKIIVSLRNPVERAYSQYLHMLTHGATTRSLREQVYASQSAQGEYFGYTWPFLELGLYSLHLKRYLASFPREQLHICFFEELQSEPRALLARLFGFLGVAADFAPNLALRYNVPQVPRLPVVTRALLRSPAWPYVRRLLPDAWRRRARPLLIRPRASLELSPPDRALLVDYYRDEVGELSRLLDRDLRGWLKLG